MSTTARGTELQELLNLHYPPVPIAFRKEAPAGVKQIAEEFHRLRDAAGSAPLGAP